MMCFSFLFLLRAIFCLNHYLMEDRFSGTVTLNMRVFYIEKCGAGVFFFLQSEKFSKTKQAEVIP